MGVLVASAFVLSHHRNQGEEISMNTHEFDRVKYSLLRELDVRFQRSYHERLSEIINDLRLHHTEIKPDANADELISIIDRSRLLYFVSDPPMKELRATFDRLRKGTFGICELCGETIPTELLEKTPTMNLCDLCFRRSVPRFS
jgi:RNA polymerase-binding transcription factor DksA